MSTTSEKKKNRFLLRTKELADMNQYWYSKHTIAMMVKEVESNATRCAFLSTPSIYFSLAKDSKLREMSKVFDIDPRFKKDPGFVPFDYNKLQDVPKELHHTFDYVVIDPPFVVEKVLSAYADAAKLLLVQDETKSGEEPKAKLMITTMVENAPIVAKIMLGAKPCAFQPSIPKLVYQYNTYTNYTPTVLCERNPEIPQADD